jgi:hypothetical protein
MVGHGAVAIVHDGDGNRVSETVGSTTTKYLIDTLNPTGYSQVLDELVSGAVTKTYTYGLQRISENQLSGSTWTPTFYGYDGHGNVRFTTNTAGTVGNTYQYDAFGMPIASTGAIANTYLDDNLGTDGTFTGFFPRYATEMRRACRWSVRGFLGRPPFRGASGRAVNSSRPATKSGVPSGRPVCVECRSRFRSAAASASAMYPCHSAAVHRMRQRSISSSGSGSVRPQWVAALDHLQCSGFAAMPARTGFNST